MNDIAIPHTLKDRLKNRRVIPFVGAGVSMAVLDGSTNGPLFPSWKVLLEEAADRLEKEIKDAEANLVRGFLGKVPADYLEAARYAREGLSGSWFPFLREHLDPPRERVEEESLALARAIWTLGSDLVITTNYDKVLKWGCPKTDNVNLWDIEAPAEQVQAMQGQLKHPTVWHLHGHIGNAADMIMTPGGYHYLYPEEKDPKPRYEAALETLRHVVVSHTIVFIGFSMDDIHFVKQLRDVHKVFDGAAGPHYVLVRETEREKVASLGLPVEIISFAEFGEPLVRLVQQLGEVAAQNQPQTPSHGPETTPVSPVTPAPYDPRNPPFYVPYRAKGKQVIGREEALLKVHEQLANGQKTAIGQTAAFQGLGGLGKTQLAVEYAYEYRHEYPNGVIWLNADQDIDAQLTDLAEKATWIAPKSEHKYKLDIARHRLRTYSQCLIIFDNLENQKAIQDYLPGSTAEPHILVTSRTDQPGFTPVPLELLDPQLSLQMLIQEAGREPVGDHELEAAQDIAKSLDGLPLALELAGAYLRHRAVSWLQYRDLLRTNLKAALPRAFLTGSFTRHDQDLYATLRVDQGVLNEEPRLREVLDLLTWSGPGPMGRDLLRVLLTLNIDAELTGALSLGVALRLLQKSPHAETYALHRLIREVRREEVPLDERQNWVHTVCARLGDWFQNLRDDFANLPRFEGEIAHLRAWLDNAHTNAPEHAARLTWLQAYPPFHRGRYQEAHAWLNKALEAYRETAKHDPVLQAHLFNDTGATCSTLGENDLAIDFHRKALNIRRCEFGLGHPDTAMSIDNVASSYGHLGDYARSLEFHQQALAIRYRLLGAGHRETTNSLSNLAATYAAFGDYDRALILHQKAFGISREALGERHPYTLRFQRRVAEMHSRLGNHSVALKIHQEVLARTLDLLGTRHPDAAASLCNVGLEYWSLANHKQAVLLSEQALDLTQTLFGEHHPATATALGNLGLACHGVGDHKRAHELEQQALAISKLVLGERHPDTASCLHNLACSYASIKNFSVALDHITDALNIRRYVLGDEHPFTLLSVISKAHILYEMGRGSKALILLNEALKRVPGNHPDYKRLAELKSKISRKARPPRHPRKHR